MTGLTRWSLSDVCPGVERWCRDHLGLSIRTLYDCTEQAFVDAYAEAQFRRLIGQHADAANHSLGITFTSGGLNADAGADVSDRVWYDDCDIASRSGVQKSPHRSIDVEPEEVLLAIAIKIDDQGRLAEVSVLDSQG